MTLADTIRTHTARILLAAHAYRTEWHCPCGVLTRTGPTRQGVKCQDCREGR